MLKNKKILLLSFIMLLNLKFTIVQASENHISYCLPPTNNLVLLESTIIKATLKTILANNHDLFVKELRNSWKIFLELQKTIKKNDKIVDDFFNLINFREQSKIQIENLFSKLYTQAEAEVGSTKIIYSRIFHNLDEIAYETIIVCNKNNKSILLKINLQYGSIVTKDHFTIEIIQKNQLTNINNKIILSQKIKEYYENHAKKIKIQIQAEINTNFAYWRDNRNLTMYNNILQLRTQPEKGEVIPSLEAMITKKFLSELLNREKEFSKSSRFKILEIGPGQGVALKQLKEKVIKNVTNELQKTINDINFLKKWGLKNPEEFVEQLRIWIQINGISLTPYGFPREIVGSACEIPWKDSSFDVVISVVSIFYIPDIQIAINEIFRTSKDNALIIGDHLAKKIKYNNKKTKLWQIFKDFLSPFNEYVPTVFNYKKNNLSNKTLDVFQVIQHEMKGKPMRYDPFQDLFFATEKQMQKEKGMMFLSPFLFIRKLLFQSA